MTPITTHTIHYGKRCIVFDLTYADRKTLGVTVSPDLKVLVRAPKGKSLDEILARVKRRAGWITRQQRQFEQYQPLPLAKQYISGETHYYLGRQYRLKVRKAEDEEVKLRGRYLWTFSADPGDRQHTRTLVQRWYREHAGAIFARRLDVCLEAAKRLKVPRPPIRQRLMKTRWGSCTKHGHIILNTELVKTPLHCIEYVIMHELCHLRERNHTDEFYRILSYCQPDWQQRKARLDAFVL